MSYTFRNASAAVALLCSIACSASGVPTPGSEPSDAGSVAIEYGDGGAPGTKSDAAGDGGPISSLVATIDGQSFQGSVACGYSQSAEARTLTCASKLGNGHTVVMTYLFEGQKDTYAPKGPVTIPRQDSILASITMEETVPPPTDPNFPFPEPPWNAKGTMTLTATGEGGQYEGHAEGVLSRKPLASKPPQPMAFTFTWKKVSGSGQ